jgi:4-amino-4-deoxy-L-arabinose transferase-like glycosyltransferase
LKVALIVKATLKHCSLYWASLSVLVIGILLRWLYLDSDPYYYDWVGYITDEGRWIQHARSLALYGTLFDSDLLSLHLFLAPLFQLSNYVVFKIAGVGLLNSRLFTALCGSAMLFVFWQFLRRTVSRQALLVGMVLLAFQTDLVMLSRVAAPEIVITFFQLVIFVVIVSTGRSSRRMVSAGLLLLVACGMKATMTLFLPIFSIIILLMPRRPTETQRWHDLTSFWIGFSVPALVTALVCYLFFLERAPTFLASLERASMVIRSQAAPARLYLYNVISFPFEHTLAPTFNFWSLGLWFGLVGWLAVDRDKIDFQLHRLLTTSVLWFVLYLFLMLSLDYFPTRYKVQVLLPMALITTLGISLVQELGMRKIINSIVESRGPAGFLWASVISFPTAVFLAPLLDSTAALAGIDPERIIVKLACVLLSWVVIAYFTQCLKRSRQAVQFLLIFPLVEGFVWTLLSTLLGVHVFWPQAEFQFSTTSLLLEILAATILAAILAKAVDRWGSAESLRLITGFAIVYSAILFFRIAPAYVSPHYTMRDSSRDLGNILSGQSSISAIRTEALFSENTVRYKSYWPVENPEMVVIAFSTMKNLLALQQNYDLVKRYKIFVSPHRYFDGTILGRYSTEGVTVKVYKKKRTARE